MKIIQAHLLSRCQAGGVSWSASSRRGCMSEDMLLERQAGFGDEERLGCCCTGESGEVVEGEEGREKRVCVTERGGERERGARAIRSRLAFL